MTVEKRMSAAGGAAFPSETPASYFLGISARDYFAAAALQGICAGASVLPPEWHGDIVKTAFQLADAMLKQRGGA